MRLISLATIDTGPHKVLSACYPVGQNRRMLVGTSGREALLVDVDTGQVTAIAKLSCNPTEMAQMGQSSVLVSQRKGSQVGIVSVSQSDQGESLSVVPLRGESEITGVHVEKSTGRVAVSRKGRSLKVYEPLGPTPAQSVAEMGFARRGDSASLTGEIETVHWISPHRLLVVYWTSDDSGIQSIVELVGYEGKSLASVGEPLVVTDVEAMSDHLLWSRKTKLGLSWSDGKLSPNWVNILHCRSDDAIERKGHYLPEYAGYGLRDLALTENGLAMIAWESGVLECGRFVDTHLEQDAKYTLWPDGNTMSPAVDIMAMSDFAAVVSVDRKPYFLEYKSQSLLAVQIGPLLEEADFAFLDCHADPDRVRAIVVYAANGDPWDDKPSIATIGVWGLKE
jgi:hypothetical protein